MCRFIFLLIIVIAIIVGIGAVFGIDVFMWVLIVGLVGSSLLLIFLPKRGDQYAFRNLYRRLVFNILILLAVVFIGGLYLLAILLPDGTPESLVQISIVGLLIVGMVVSFIVIRPYYPVAQSRAWFRKNFPDVKDSIFKYKQKGDVVDDNNPILHIEQNQYFLIPFFKSGMNPDDVDGYLLLDDLGNPVDDKDLVRKAAKCRTLALQTFDYGLNQDRARTIENHHQAMVEVRRMYSILEENRDVLDQVSPAIREDVEQIISAEDSILQMGQISIDIAMLEAKWAKDHGLGRLKEIHYEEVQEFEEELREIRLPMIEMISQLQAVGASAVRLANAIDIGQIAILDSHFLREVFLGIAEGTETIDSSNDDIYGVMTEELWQSWRDRMEWVRKVDAGVTEAGA